MRPALSVVFLTTLIGAGQGLFVATYAADLAARAGLCASATPFPIAAASFASVALCAAGLVASFFHLGRPERAWRAAAMWRTSWLSREVIALPAFMALVAAYGHSHAALPALAPWLGAAALLACAALFYCTSMIYACVKFLQEWASPFTTPNFVLMGCASGFLLAAALAPADGARPFALAALLATLGALASRLASLARNRRIQLKSTIQSATGLQHPQVRQVSQGFTARSFNTEEFFHGRSPAFMQGAVAAFVVLGFVVPAAMAGLSLASGARTLLPAAFLVQYAGLLLERWHFLADSRHPQNLYYQRSA